jgi:hypothetical protein
MFGEQTLRHGGIWHQNSAEWLRLFFLRGPLVEHGDEVSENLAELLIFFGSPIR